MTENKLKAKEGRPTKYDPFKMLPMVAEYISSCGREQTSLPTIEGLAQHLDVDSDTIRNWSKEHQEFFVTIKKMTDKQKQQLMEDGMYGGKEVNAAMAIFLLKCNHGMNDGSGMNVHVSGEKVIAILGGRSNVPGDDSTTKNPELIQED